MLLEVSCSRKEREHTIGWGGAILLLGSFPRGLTIECFLSTILLAAGKMNLWFLKEVWCVYHWELQVTLSPFIKLQSSCQVLLSPHSAPFFHLLFSESREASQDWNLEHQSDNFLLLLLFFNLRVFTLG